MIGLPDYHEGQVILIDKPQTWTSFDVVNKLRYTLKVKKIGHAGTLDPLATGLLILCTGKLTKQIDTYQAQEKEYTGKLMLGKTTPSFDSETPFDKEYPTEHITQEAIYKAIKLFMGIIEQTPPMYSAVKIEGKKLYELARKGKSIEVPSRQVTIYDFEITDVTMPEISFRVVCSKGTYIRTLVNDFGIALHSGAYLSELRRTRIGGFSVKDALTVDGFIERLKGY